MAEWVDGVSPTTVGRGDSVTVALGDVERFRTVRVELVMTERRLTSRAQVKKSNDRTVASARASSDAGEIELSIPRWVSDTFRGETVAWDYAVHVVGDRRGPDSKKVVPIVVRGGVALDATAKGYTDACDSGPMRILCGVGKPPEQFGLGRLYDRSDRWWAVAMCVGLGIFFVVFGFNEMQVLAMILGAVAVLGGVFVAFTILRDNSLPIDHVDVEIPPGVNRLGEPIELKVSSPLDPNIEIGIEGIEMEVDHGNQKRFTRRTIVVERFRPLTESNIAIPSHPDDPGGYGGQLVALHWTVSMRMVATPDDDRDAQTRRIPIARLP